MTKSNKCCLKSEAGTQIEVTVQLSSSVQRSWPLWQTHSLLNLRQPRVNDRHSANNHWSVNRLQGVLTAGRRPAAGLRSIIWNRKILQQNEFTTVSGHHETAS